MEIGQFLIPRVGFIPVLGLYLQPAGTEKNILVALWGERNYFSTEGIPQPGGVRRGSSKTPP